MVERIKFYVDAGWNMVHNVLMAVCENDPSHNSQESRPGIDPVRRTRRLNNAMPELEEIAAEATHTEESTPRTALPVAEIEPAFLDTQDYPAGWLIYDPKLGIVRQEEVLATG